MKAPACINIAFVVPNEVPENASKKPEDENFAVTADEVQEVLEAHAAHMVDFYPDQEHLLCSYFTKGPLFKNPTNPDEGEAEPAMTCFYIAEVKHPKLEKNAKWLNICFKLRNSH